MTDVLAAEAGAPFFVVDLYSGVPGSRPVVRTGRCPMQDVNKQAAGSEWAVMGVADDASQVWDDVAGELVAVISAPEPEPEPAITAITPRQLFIGMMQAGFVTAEEAVAAAATGAIPASVEALMATLPPIEEATARITWARATVINRSDPLVGLLAEARGLTTHDVDAFFRTCAAL